MTTTAKALRDAAYSRSAANDPDKLATDFELIGVIDRRLKQIYSFAARNNPFYFGQGTSVTGDATKWPRPTAAELVFKVEADGPAGTGVDRKITTVGAEVSIVPFEDREAEMAPRVYPLGRAYYSVGIAATDPSASVNGDKLKFYYSRRHADLNPALPPTDAANTLDADWPEQFNDLIVLHLAKYLNVKDVARSAPEFTALDAEEKALFGVFAQHLEHENYGMKARWGQVSRVVSPTVRGADVR